MEDSEIIRARELTEEIRNIINDESDKGISGQGNTFEYVANSQEAAEWAAGTTVGATLLERLKTNSSRLRSFMFDTIAFVNAIDEYLNAQERINAGKYDGGVEE